MLVLKSTHNQMKAEAKANGRALHEMAGELIDGMKKLGFDPEPKHMMDTTAKRAIAALRGQMIVVEQLRDELAAARAALKEANAKLARLTTRGPGGRFVKPPVAAAVSTN